MVSLPTTSSRRRWKRPWKSRSEVSAAALEQPRRFPARKREAHRRRATLSALDAEGAAEHADSFPHPDEAEATLLSCARERFRDVEAVAIVDDPDLDGAPARSDVNLGGRGSTVSADVGEALL